MSSSRVMHLPPALVILALAASVNLSAATVSLGTSIILSSSVTVETTTTVLSCFSPRCFTNAALLSQHHSHFLASPVGYLYERGDR